MLREGLIVIVPERSREIEQLVKFWKLNPTTSSGLGCYGLRYRWISPRAIFVLLPPFVRVRIIITY